MCSMRATLDAHRGRAPAATVPARTTTGAAPGAPSAIARRQQALPPWAIPQRYAHPRVRHDGGTGNALLLLTSRDGLGGRGDPPMAHTEREGPGESAYIE